ncbi:RimK family alpha-L-glutamate ligase [Sphingomonas sp. AP4-R1]|uniref:ATP-grasp domain-containing protein n=1 Tax=Sphingomonas sp. AP4-R1 TaxID=2735134 RepID=UPI0020A3F571|nr:tetratricopeptide repeat-containing protein [Sphingomonas sp. AP4-R1]
MQDAIPAIDARSEILGLHRVLPMAFNEIDVSGHLQALADRIVVDARDAAAMMDMSMLLQAHSFADQARSLLDEATRIQKDFCIVHGDGSGIRLLAFVTPGDFMANTPLDFLLNGSNAVLWLHFVDGDTADLRNLPAHDVAFFAIGEANHHGPVLTRMAELLAGWDGPIMNNDPTLIAGLTRDGVSALLDDEPSILVPANRRFPRDALAAVAAGADAMQVLGSAFPLIVRPIGTHAGHGMDKLDDEAAIARYLDGEGSTHFYAAPFIDYRGAEGWFSKQRIVLIDGKPYPSHLALSDHWMVHYLNAGMMENARKRAIEADWMERFDDDFAVRHRAAFEALYRRIGLDYFGIDCAELPDGRLLVFELDVAMVVHDMDDVTVFPYKKPAMQALFDGFVAAAEARRLPVLEYAA